MALRSLAPIRASLSRAIVDLLGWPPRSAPADHAPFRWLDCAELAGLRVGGAMVIDVRGPDEFSGPLGHIAGAVNLPLQVLQGDAAALPDPAGRPICLVCHTDRRSAAAASLIRARGFRDVGVLRGGMVRWRAEGLPVAGATAADGAIP